MVLVTDRDVLQIEPSVYVDALGAATILSEVDNATLAGNTLSFLEPVLEGVRSSHVAVVRGEALEILHPVGTAHLQVRRPLADTECPTAVPPPGSGLNVKIVTLDRTLRVVQHWACDALEVALDGVDGDGRPVVVDEGGLKRFIAYETLARAFAAAAAQAPDDESLAVRAALYQAHADKARRMVSVRVDTTGDGSADATRRMAGGRMRRS